MRHHDVGHKPMHLGGARLLLGIAACLVLAVGLVACGGGSGSGNSSSSSLAAYRNCLKAHGVNLPANFTGRRPSGSYPTGSVPSGTFPTGSFPQGSRPGGLGNAKFRSVNSACRSKLPKGSTSGFPGGGGGNGTPGNGSLSNFQAFSSCMSDNGVKLNGTGPSALSSLNQNDPTVQAALKKCSPLLQSGSTTTSHGGG